MAELDRALASISAELESWLEALRVSLRAELASFWWVDRSARRLVRTLTLPASTATEHELPTAVPLDGHALGWVVREGVSVRATRDDVFRTGIDGWVVAAPVADRRGEPVACAAVHFDGIAADEALTALELASAVAGRLIMDARLTEGAILDMAKHEALYRAVYDLDRDLNLDGLAHSVCRRAREVTGADGAIVAVWDAATAEATILTAEGDLNDDPTRIRFAGEASFLGLAMLNGTVLPRDELDLEGKEKFPLYAPGLAVRARSSIIVPIVTESMTIGAVAVHYGEPRRFTDADRGRLIALARFVAPSFRNAVEFGAIRAESLTDALTGLSNRRSTERALDSTIAIAERSHAPFAVAILDIDHFKAFNDRHGHEAGDFVLQSVAELIRDSLRPGDMAGRWGGEEFLVVLPSTDAADAAHVADRIRRNVERAQLMWGDRALGVTVSVGVASYPEAVKSGSGAVTAADAALYRAKREGRNAVALANPGD